MNNESENSDAAFYRYLCGRLCEAPLPELIIILRFLSEHPRHEGIGIQIEATAEATKTLQQALAKMVSNHSAQGTRLERAIYHASIAQLAFEIRAHPVDPNTPDLLEEVADALDVEARKFALWFRAFRGQVNWDNT